MPIDQAELELVPLGTMTLQLAAPLILSGTPGGMRLIVELEGGRLEGDRIAANVKGRANADWMLMGHGGTSALDVRILLETDDGALVFMRYQGRIRDGVIYSAPTFETGDERYTWLNHVQAVGRGATEGSTLTYRLYELR